MKNSAVHCLLLLFLVLFTIPLVSAQQQQFDGLDVLFLVDQSGSMGGANFGYPDERNPRDPDGLRFEVLSYALDTLTQYQAVVPQNTPFRIAVVYFGDNPLTMLDWRTIGSGADWQTQAAEIKDQLSAGNFQRNLGNTDFLGAFEEANRLFASLPPNENHLRVIVVLTDGAPCAPSRFSNPQCTTAADQIDHMQDLIIFASQSYPRPQYRIHTIAIDASNTFWPTFAPYWEQVTGATGSAVRVEDNAQIGQQFVGILVDGVQGMGSSSAAEDDAAGSTIGEIIQFVNQRADIDVPPYHQLMRLTVFKLQPDAQISLTDPQGISISETSPNVIIAGREGAIETWTVTNPAPGRWLLATSEASRSSVSLDLIRVTWRFDPLPESINRYTGIPLRLQLIDTNNQPLPIYTDSRYQLAITLTAYPPDGITEMIPFTSNPDGAFTASFIPVQQGDYRFDLLATTQNVDGSPLTIFDQQDVLRFTVETINLQAEIEPQGDLLVSQSITITARLLNNSGELLQLPGATVEVGLTSPGGSTTYDLIAQPGQAYITTLPMDQPGQYQVRVRAQMTDAGGSDILIGEQVFNPFNVRPAAFVLLRLLQPQNLTEYLTTGFPPTTPVDTLISVQASNDSGENIDLAALAGGTVPLQGTVTALTPDTEFIPQTFTLHPTDTTGLYEGVIPNLPAGDYTVMVEADRSVTLANSTLFDPRTFTQSLRLTRANNPALIAFIVGSVVLIVAVVSGITFLILRQRSLRMHPARGKIEIFREPYDETDIPLTSISLDRERKNRIRRSSPAPGVKSIEIRCPNNAMSSARQVFVTIETEGGQPLNSTLLAPHDERYFTAGRGNELEYRIVKDRDADYDL